MSYFQTTFVRLSVYEIRIFNHYIHFLIHVDDHFAFAEFYTRTQDLIRLFERKFFEKRKKTKKHDHAGAENGQLNKYIHDINY